LGLFKKLENSPGRRETKLGIGARHSDNVLSEVIEVIDGRSGPGYVVPITEVDCVEIPDKLYSHSPAYPIVLSAQTAPDISEELLYMIDPKNHSHAN
jgi:hypothetical protein